MANELIAVLESGIATQATFSQFNNEKLQRLTMRIYELTQATKRNLFEIAVHLATIKAEELYKTENYKSIEEYAEKNFGYKKSMVYKMLNVADKFIEAREIDGKTVYMSRLAHDDVDYSVSQLMEINAVEFDDAKSLDAVGSIMPSMTTKVIREVVKNFKNGKIDENGQPVNSATNNGDNDTNNGDNDTNNGDNDTNNGDNDTNNGDICREFNAIIEHCNNLLISVTLDVKVAEEVYSFMEYARRFVTNYKHTTTENCAN